MISVLFCLLLLGQGALSYELHINNASEFIQFSKNVNSGNSYSWTTVFLDADIDFSGGLSDEFEPIGKDWYNYFHGTFDGQGHAINNLSINSFSDHVGLFGYSKDATIRNVVMDSSCSVVSSYSGSSSDAYVGGVVGLCYGYRGPCVIENTVNMASVAFIGNTTGNLGVLLIGGIVGDFSASNKGITVKNCANYGSVTHSGTSSDADIGGIVGYSSGSSPNKVFIQNCLNYGTITHNGTTVSDLYTGGILGSSSSGTNNNLENCVSGGKIISNKATNNNIGSIVGQINSFIIITHCYWTSDVGNYKAYGSRSSTMTLKQS